MISTKLPVLFDHFGVLNNNATLMEFLTLQMIQTSVSCSLKEVKEHLNLTQSILYPEYTIHNKTKWE